MTFTKTANDVLINLLLTNLNTAHQAKTELHRSSSSQMFYKRSVYKNSQNSLETICAGVSVVIKLQSPTALWKIYFGIGIFS